MKTVAQITMNSGYVLELKSVGQEDLIQGPAAALRLLFPQAVPSARYEAMLQIAGVWNVLQQLAGGEDDQERSMPFLSSDMVPYSQAMPQAESIAESPEGSPSLARGRQSIRLDVEILKAIESMSPGSLNRTGIVGLLRPAFPTTLGDQVEVVLVELARMKWITLGDEDNDVAFRLTERGIGALRMARQLGH